MEWARVLAYITGTVDQELLLRNEYLVAENRILKSQLKGRLKLSDVERTKLGEIGHRLGRKALGEVAATAPPDTILAWYRRLIARKFDGSQARRAPGRPRIDGEVEQLIVRMADENRSWGYDRIVGALANLGHEISDQTVGNVLRRHGLPSAPARKHTTTWAAFIRVHLAVLAGTDFFTVEVLTLRGLVTYYVLFFIHLESRKVEIAGITIHPNEQWMQQMARNVTMEGCGTLRDCRYLLHDRDTKYTISFRAIIESGRGKTLPLPARSPNLNAYAERWVRSVKEECLSKIIVFGERSLRRALSEYVAHYQAERNHQGKSNVLIPVQAAHYNEMMSPACRRCGRKLTVRYTGAKHNIPRYSCWRGSLDNGEPRCIAFGGLRVDDAIEEALLRVVEPAAIAAAVEAEAQAASRRDQVREALARELEAARHRADRAFRQYDAIDPQNRLIAAELELRWNSGLIRVGEIETRIAAHDAATSEPSRSPGHVAALAADLKAVWSAPPTDARLKKRIVRTVIHEVVADIDDEASEIVLLIHWMGGVHTELRLPRRRRGRRNSISADMLAAIRQLVLIANDDLIAGILIRNGLVTGHGNRWTRERVTALRSHHKIPVFRPVPDGSEPWLNLNKAAGLLGIEQLAVDARRTPKQILRAHLPDQRAQFCLDLRSPSPSRRFPTPIAAKAGPMPTHQPFG